MYQSKKVLWPTMYARIPVVFANSLSVLCQVSSTGQWTGILNSVVVVADVAVSVDATAPSACLVPTAYSYPFLLVNLCVSNPSCLLILPNGCELSWEEWRCQV